MTYSPPKGPLSLPNCIKDQVSTYELRGGWYANFQSIALEVLAEYSTMRQASLRANLVPKQLCESWEPLRLGDSLHISFPHLIQNCPNCVSFLFSYSVFPCSDSLYYCSPIFFHGTPQNYNNDRHFYQCSPCASVLSRYINSFNPHITVLWQRSYYDPCFIS